MKYRYETHLHTMESSLCGKISGADHPAFYKARGYHGIMITDHFYRGNTAIPTDLPWAEFVTRFFAGYEAAKKAGDEIGITVFFGLEERFDALDEYLIYGLTKEWLIAHPELRTLPREQYLALVRAAGAMVVQAHPMREYSVTTEIVLPLDALDAVEGWNGGTNLAQNSRAIAVAAQNGLPVTAGSDLHLVQTKDRIWPNWGIETDTKLETVADYIELIRHGKWEIYGVPYEAEPPTEAGVPVRVVSVYGEPMTLETASEKLPPAIRGNATC